MYYTILSNSHNKKRLVYTLLRLQLPSVVNFMHIELDDVHTSVEQLDHVNHPLKPENGAHSQADDPVNVEGPKKLLEERGATSVEAEVEGYEVELGADAENG